MTIYDAGPLAAGPLCGLLIFGAAKNSESSAGERSLSSKRGDHQPYTTTTKCFRSKRGIFEGVVYELSEPKRAAKYTPPPGLHWQCSSWLLWGWCADCGVRQERGLKLFEYVSGFFFGSFFRVFRIIFLANVKLFGGKNFGSDPCGI